jgi:hypothetical protein
MPMMRSLLSLPVPSLPVPAFRCLVILPPFRFSKLAEGHSSYLSRDSNKRPIKRLI